jgi:superfamily I DNA/RNA helicase
MKLVNYGVGEISDRLTILALKTELAQLFEDQDRGVLTLSTIHKAKGREWPTVAILQPELMPSGWATKDWEQQQETNLKYVAITRARERLIWLDGKLEE